MSYLSVFEVIGPPMVGPSSSHTAGACRIGWVARTVLGQDPLHAEFSLHGSFLATGTGHGTREALVAGVLLLDPACENLKDSLKMARTAGMSITFGEVDLGPQAHPNSVVVKLVGSSTDLSLTASSIGGGSIRIQELDGYSAEIHGTLNSLIVWHEDRPGFLAQVTAGLACMELNVAAIRTSRRERSGPALTIIEIDGRLSEEMITLLGKIPSVTRLSTLPVLPGF